MASRLTSRSPVINRHFVSKKNIPPVTCYNLDTHGSIAVIFGTDVTEKVGNQNVLYFPPHLTNASALPGETGNPKIAFFHLNAAWFFFYQKHTKHIKISPSYS